ncbi:hypothetical protein AOQ84DRAFT_350555 [Glonium stellatum]|uniref:Large ribosomal subunit protein uL23m n=1 Tax=Glonium stellatum TaxID=574774 RepID=A0A8E2EMQ1_9PEZI|nr:hypothetical protein AOQ84DRAFT_350555 [Glonium stellatum]
MPPISSLIKFGKKEIYLPKFIITLLHTPQLPPTHAKFLVPLNFNKLDLRDYLYHVYNVKSMNIRTYIQQQKVQQDRPGVKAPQPRRWFRPRAIKKMTVEMDKPFVWPEQPENMDAWSKEAHNAMTKTQQRQDTPEAQRDDHNEMAEALSRQAKDLLAGKSKWKPTWVDYGDEVEVERDVRI